MFKENKTTPEASLFTSFDQTLSKKKQKRLQDKRSWDNLFRVQIVDRIDENLFSVLYSQDAGRPNSSIRTLVGMMILKEGFGWSDSEMYDACRFNLLIMNSLGFSNVSDEVPVESTYYDFKKKLFEYDLNTGRSLIAEVFEQTTKIQAEIFSLNPRWIRMDSKLVGSNIANCTRLQLIIGCLQYFYKSLDVNLRKRIKKNDRKELEELNKYTAQQITYKLTNEQKSELLKKYGLMLSRLIDAFRDNGHGGLKNLDKDKYQMITRLFGEQYMTVQSEVEIKKSSEIPSDALQSPFDQDAAYRNKDYRPVKGYSINVVESCNKSGLNLVTGAAVYKANTSDNAMFRDAVEQTERISGKDAVKEISADGAYHSLDNETYAIEKAKKVYLTGLPGFQGNFHFEYNHNGELMVTSSITGNQQLAKQTAKGYYIIKDHNNKTRYFRQNQINSYFKRKDIERLPDTIKNIRCNVEATIFQTCLHLRKDKTRYRGRIKNKIWLLCRVMWLNLKRIKNYVQELYPAEQLSVAIA